MFIGKERMLGVVKRGVRMTVVRSYLGHSCLHESLRKDFEASAS